MIFIGDIENDDENDNDNENNSGSSNESVRESISQSIKTAKISNQVIRLFAMILSSVSAFVSLSSPHGFFMTVKQFQLILLTLLTNAYIPKNIIEFMSGMKWLTCSFSFIPFHKIYGLDKIVDWFDSDLIFDRLKHFDIESGSSFINMLSIL